MGVLGTDLHCCNDLDVAVEAGGGVGGVMSSCTLAEATCSCNGFCVCFFFVLFFVWLEIVKYLCHECCKCWAGSTCPTKKNVKLHCCCSTSTSCGQLTVTGVPSVLNVSMMLVRLLVIRLSKSYYYLFFSLNDLFLSVEKVF